MPLQYGGQPRRSLLRRAFHGLTGRTPRIARQLTGALDGIEPGAHLIEGRQALADARGRERARARPCFGEDFLGGVHRAFHYGKLDDASASLQGVKGSKHGVETLGIVRRLLEASRPTPSACTSSRDSIKNWRRKSFIARLRTAARQTPPISGDIGLTR